MHAHALFLLPLLVGVSACGVLSPASGAELTYGCYYVQGTPVLRVQDGRGTFLIPGDVRATRVSTQLREGEQEAIFEPGFRLQLRPSLKTVSPADLPQPRIYLLMKPGTSVPTVMVHTEPLGMVDLVRGEPC